MTAKTILIPKDNEIGETEKAMCFLLRKGGTDRIWIYKRKIHGSRNKDGVDYSACTIFLEEDIKIWNIEDRRYKVIDVVKGEVIWKLLSE